MVIDLTCNANTLAFIAGSVNFDRRIGEGLRTRKGPSPSGENVLVNTPAKTPLELGRQERQIFSTLERLSSDLVIDHIDETPGYSSV